MAVDGVVWCSVMANGVVAVVWWLVAVVVESAFPLASMSEASLLSYRLQSQPE